jgi:hypothetical protein
MGRVTPRWSEAVAQVACNVDGGRPSSDTVCVGPP